MSRLELLYLGWFQLPNDPTLGMWRFWMRCMDQGSSLLRRRGEKLCNLLVLLTFSIHTIFSFSHITFLGVLDAISKFWKTKVTDKAIFALELISLWLLAGQNAHLWPLCPPLYYDGCPKPPCVAEFCVVPRANCIFFLNGHIQFRFGPASMIPIQGLLSRG